MTAAPGTYPFGLEVDGPMPQSRLTVLLRLILAIPHLIVLYVLSIVASIIIFISWFIILFTGSYPAGLMNFMVNFLHWNTRVAGYLLLLTDKYPPFSMGPDGSYPVRLLAVGQLEGRNRLTTFWLIRIILAIPHLIIIGVLQYVAGLLAFIASIVALVTGSVPGGLHNFLAGFLRWTTRANAYIYLLTDEYPPFSMN